MKKVWILMIVALVALVSCASAETVMGTIGGYGINQTMYYVTSPDTTSGHPVSGLYAPNFELLGIPSSLVTWINTVPNSFTIDGGAPAGSTIPVTIRISNDTLNASGFHTYTTGRVVGTGTLGYQKVFDTATPPVEQLGSYVWLAIDTWDQGTETGAQHLYLEYDWAAFYHLSWKTVASTAPTGSFLSLTARGSAGTAKALGSASPKGSSYIKDTSIYAGYIVTKPSGLGISGTIIKEIEGTNYTSQAFVFNADTNATITSEALLSSNQYNFSILSQSMFVGVRDSNGVFYNSSVLFTGGAPTPTPTPTPTGTPIGPDNPIPAGYVRSMVQCVDGQSSGTIHECQINIKDVENGTWSNGSYGGMGSYYGTWWIDTLPTHTIDAYGSATGYSSVSRTGLPASGTKMYELLMWPSYIPAPTAGSVNFYVIVNDAASGLALPTASVRVVDSSTGITHVRQTGTNGVGSFVVTNSTLMHVTVSKTGYIDATATMTTTAAGPDTLRVELLKAVVTTAPTNTIPPGGVTTAVTVDSRTSEQKATGAMNILYDNGENIIGVCVLVTILGLLGVRLGK